MHHKSWEQDLHSDPQSDLRSQLMIINLGQEQQKGEMGQRRRLRTHVANAAWPPWTWRRRRVMAGSPKAAQLQQGDAFVLASLLRRFTCIQFAAHLPHHSIFRLIRAQLFPSPVQAHFRPASFRTHTTLLLATLDQHLFPLFINSL